MHRSQATAYERVISQLHDSSRIRTAKRVSQMKKTRCKDSPKQGRGSEETDLTCEHFPPKGVGL